MGLYTICQIIITFEWNSHTSQKLFMKEITFVFSEQIAIPKWLPEREVLLFFFPTLVCLQANIVSKLLVGEPTTHISLLRVSWETQSWEASQNFIERLASVLAVCELDVLLAACPDTDSGVTPCNLMRLIFL